LKLGFERISFADMTLARIHKGDGVHPVRSEGHEDRATNQRGVFMFYCTIRSFRVIFGLGGP
jgi:hypothetical protein